MTPANWKEMTGGLAYIFKWSAESIKAITVPDELMFWNDRIGEINERLEAEARKR